MCLIPHTDLWQKKKEEIFATSSSNAELLVLCFSFLTGHTAKFFVPVQTEFLVSWSGPRGEKIVDQ